ncbi:MAG: cobyrinate a,c-diamide synthase [Chloroflexota bacterium]|jgi:cobyrinic acid a,c-diamide synthase
MNYPRLVVAAPQGRSGKTTITLGLVASLVERGLVVQPFKKGPDYIDPSWLTGAGGRPCRNLDLFMMDQAKAVAAFCRGMEGADVAIVEGAMGMYDGLDLEGTGSTAQLARVLSAPIILVVDTTRMTRSVAALVSGYQHFEPDVNVAGVILNKVARARHEKMLVAAIERYCQIPVLGCIPKREELSIPDRHLGLIPRAEDHQLVPAIENARRLAKQYLDLDRIIEIARSVVDPTPIRRGEQEGDLGCPQRAGPGRSAWRGLGCPQEVSSSAPVKIAVLMDRVFTFYYPENLEALEDAGARLVYLDSMADHALPDVDGLYIGGGFPEVFMEQLEANRSLREDIRKRAIDGLPVYAECAGLIYLSRRIRWGDRSAEMVGLLPCEIEMTGKPQGHGYAVAEVVADTPFFRRGEVLRGHEFHNTRISALDRGEMAFAYSLSRGSGIDAEHKDGLSLGNVLASYVHLHAAAAPMWAERFVEACRKHRAGAVHSR